MSKVELAEEALRDLELIFDYLAAAYQEFGETPLEAIEHAGERLRGILASADKLARTPFQGTAHEHLGPGVRQVTRQRAVFYFQVTDDKTIRILAVFFGGQDHQRRMRLRLLRDD